MLSSHSSNEKLLAIDVESYNAPCRFWDGIYVLYTYGSHPRTAQGVQKLLSTPVVGAENTLLRHMTFRK